MKMWMSAVLLTILGCGSAKEGGAADVRVEGTEPGDCTDRADNDGDSLFDCDDDGCANSPDCDTNSGGDDEQHRYEAGFDPSR